MRRAAHTRRTEASSPALARWGAVAACLGGVSYGASGYLDVPDASRFVAGVVVPVLGVATPALFLGSLAGLYSWPRMEGSRLWRVGLLVGLVGTVLGVFDELDWWESDRWILLYTVLTAIGVGLLVGLYFWPRREGNTLGKTGLLAGLVGTVLGLVDGMDWLELNWWILLFVALTAAGVDMTAEDALRLPGVLVLASGVLGWVSLLTDPDFAGVLVPARSVHVAFAALFCLGCVAWGGALFARFRDADDVG